MLTDEEIKIKCLEIAVSMQAPEGVEETAKRLFAWVTTPSIPPVNKGYGNRGKL